MARPVTALIIMDGFGIREDAPDNAIERQGYPNIKRLMDEYPHTAIAASGLAVGLPEGQMGNSEVGHTNIGAGRVIYQELTRISKSIDDGDFFQNEVLIAACKNAGADKQLHLIGLLSDGGVHSHIEHLIALLRLAKMQGVQNVYVHALMDGRDVPPDAGKGYIAQLQTAMDELGCGSIATVLGRYYAMDRDNRWERVQMGYDCMVNGKGAFTAPDAIAAVGQAYDRDETDEFISPTVVLKDGKPTAVLQEGDSVVFFNFRPDRAREITRTMIEPDFAEFAREGGYKPVHYVCMTQYDVTFKGVAIAFPSESKVINPFGEYISSLGKTQLRIAETEKYAHVTFFFNCGIEEPSPGEERVLIPSPKVATYDLQPEMSAPEVAAEAVRHVESGKYDAMVLNFANCDMVGHTGIIEAAMAAVKAVDEGVGLVVDAILKSGGSVIITADHGNADQMIDPATGGPFTAHTTSLVPFILVSPAYKGAKLKQDGRLSDLTPTMLQLMGLPKPAEMSGQSMIEG